MSLTLAGSLFLFLSLSLSRKKQLRPRSEGRKRGDDQHHGVRLRRSLRGRRRRRAEPHLHLADEDPQLADAARGHQAAQEPARVLRAAQRAPGLHQGEIRRDLPHAAVRGGDGGVQRDPGAGPAGAAKWRGAGATGSAGGPAGAGRFDDALPD